LCWPGFSLVFSCWSFGVVVVGWVVYLVARIVLLYTGSWCGAFVVVVVECVLGFKLCGGWRVTTLSVFCILFLFCCFFMVGG